MVLEVKTVAALGCVVWQKGIGKDFWDAGEIFVLGELPKYTIVFALWKFFVLCILRMYTLLLPHGRYSDPFSPCEAV